VRSAHAIPVLGGGAAIGVLNLFRAAPGGLGDADGALAHLLVDAVNATLYHGSLPTGTLVGADQLMAAVTDTVVIERAQGMLAVRLRIDLDTAYAVLRHVARDGERTVSAVAAQVVAGTADITLPLCVAPPPTVTGTD
jgi:hypothetical protein